MDIVPESPIENILERLAKVKATGPQKWQACCPAHEDRDPSLSIATGHDGSVLLHCHAGCSAEEIVAAVDLTMSDLYPEGQRKKGRENIVPLARDAVVTGGEWYYRRQTQENSVATTKSKKPKKSDIQPWKWEERGMLEATYEYVNEDGEILFEVLRSTDKDFRQRRPDPEHEGRYVYDLKGVARVPYRLTAVIGAIERGETVFLTEGEKDADRLHSIDLTATTFSGGAKNWHKSETDWLDAADIVIIPDNDGPGREHAAALSERYPNARVLLLPDVPEKGDISDWLDAGHTKDELISLVEREARVMDRGEIVGDGIRPLPDLLPVPKFDPDLIPDGPFRRYLMSLVGSDGYLIEFLFTGLIAMLSSIIGRQVTIAPRGLGKDWRVTLSLWGAGIGTPSVVKTSPVKAILRLIERLEEDAEREYKEEKKRFDMAIQEWEVKNKALQEMTKEKTKGKDNKKVDLDALRMELLSSKPEEPLQKHYKVSDFTEEALGQKLTGNPNGFLIYRDEISGMLASLAKEYNKSTKQFLLELWGGSGTYTIIRKGSEDITIKNMCAGIFGTAQPDIIRGLIRDQEAVADGFLARFQLMVWPDNPYIDDDGIVDREAERECEDIVYRLANIDTKELGAIDEEGDKPPVLIFDSEAQAAYTEWRRNLLKMVRGGSLSNRWQEFLGKYPSLVPSLALIYHITEGGKGPVKMCSLEKAIAVAAWLEAHLQRILHYGKQTPPHMLLAHIQSGKLGDTFNVRDIKRHCWSGLKDDNIVADALDTLEEHGYIEREEKKAGSKGGRPTVLYRVKCAITSSAGEDAA